LKLLKISSEKEYFNLLQPFFLVAKHFFVDLLLLLLPPGAKVFDHCQSCDTGLFDVDKFLPTDVGIHEQSGVVPGLVAFLTWSFQAWSLSWLCRIRGMSLQAWSFQAWSFRAWSF
jgi:hypothetical protein